MYLDVWLIIEKAEGDSTLRFSLSMRRRRMSVPLGLVDQLEGGG